MKHFLLFIGLFFFVSFSTSAETVFSLKNTSSFDRINEVVEVPVSDEVFASLASLALYDENNTTVPYQALSQKKIVFQATVSAGSIAIYTLKAGTPATAQTKTYAAQKGASRDDAAWENNLAAYRMYSKKLLTSEPNT
ncbi:MAG: DUF4861 domain-containing protein, partial [Dysgonamonadaceae bacterium]|nr:DUF4861 domain-containing protein [Dysgonamonadaceae bacterium]